VAHWVTGSRWVCANAGPRAGAATSAGPGRSRHQPHRHQPRHRHPGIISVVIHDVIIHDVIIREAVIRAVITLAIGILAISRAVIICGAIINVIAIRGMIINATIIGAIIIISNITGNTLVAWPTRPGAGRCPAPGRRCAQWFSTVCCQMGGGPCGHVLHQPPGALCPEPIGVHPLPNRSA